MRVRMMKVLKVLAWLLLSVQVVMSGAFLVSHLTDHRVMVITSGSMEPTYSTGDAVLLDISDRTPEVGQSITFHAYNDVLTTHRVISVHPEEKGGTFLRTQGDANESPDVDLVHIDDVMGLPGARFDSMGYVIAWLTSPVGRLLTFGPILVLVTVQELRKLKGLTARRESRARHAEQRTMETV